ncbi:DUF2491 family protein [Azospirillum picis]|uniref:DUF2491 family protein n=1 Tax=Azospirillum picis TaxID=488438 RepID=A0ABU0MCN9_9PROT|nr:DUF2491 family protein [Azospirillum picis]MBP2297780.1 hypothetical protein [Azospirillum picis]MDQ0531197.1 hypothetical protein [Azospirillum picis]
MPQIAKPRWPGRLRAAAVALLMAVQPLAAPAGALLTASRTTAAATAVVAAAVPVVAMPGEAEARAGSSSRSSGGYSRPSRTPSTGSSSGYSRPSPSRTPSTGGGWFSGGSSSSSGGYARPGSSAPSVAAPPTSAGDRAFSQQGSADALNRYRARQDADRTPSAPAAGSAAGTGRTGGSASSGSGGSGWGWGWGSNSGSYRTPSTRPAPANPYGGYGWAPPPYTYNAPRRFGVWDGLFLWFLLDTLTRPGHAAFFHDHADDPGYREWRQEADRLAQDNADLRAKLGQLDQSMAAQAGTPREAGRLPPDVPADLARADSASASASPASSAEAADPARPGHGSGFGGLWLWSILLLAVAALFLLWRARRRMDNPPVASGPVSKGGSDVPLFGTLGNYVNQKLGGQRYSPALFRLGMTVSIDPAPFLLAEGATKVKAPDTGGDRLVSIEAVGTVTSGPATVYRLHLPVGGFFQIHLGPDGQPDECRYFTPIDSVAPADESEWGFWLDDAEGMIGWPEFQTKDGKLYPRIWQPGGSRIQPFTLSESRQTVRGTETVTSQAMLYGAPTGASAPAPQTEYILVEAVERAGRASVEIAAGIDVNPASLSLS